MDPVAADLWHGFHYRRDLDSGLPELVAYYKSDVARSDHEDFLARNYSVYVHEGLDRSRSVYSRKVVVREGDEPFLRSRRHYCLLRLDPVVFVFAFHRGEDALFRIVACDCGVGPNVHSVTKGFYFVKKDVGYLVAACPRIFVLASKELVRLLHKLAAGVKVALYYRYLRSRSRSFCRSAKTCRSAAYYEEVCLYRLLHISRLPLFRFQWNLALAVLGLHLHACLQRRYAGTHVGHSVYYHEA